MTDPTPPVMTAELTIKDQTGNVVANVTFPAFLPYVWRTLPEFPLEQEVSSSPHEMNVRSMFAFTYQPTVVLRPKQKAGPMLGGMVL